MVMKNPLETKKEDLLTKKKEPKMFQNEIQELSDDINVVNKLLRHGGLGSWLRYVVRWYS